MKARLILTICCLFLSAPFVKAGKKDQEKRLQKAAQTMQEILKIPDGIPSDLLDKAECVVVMPSVKKFALGIGAATGEEP